MVDRPIRLQLSRRKGFDLQALSIATNGLPAVKVSRPGPWGNPFNFAPAEFCWLAFSFGCRGDAAGRRAASVLAFREWIDGAEGKRVAHVERQVMMDDGKGLSVPIGAKMAAGLAPSREEMITALRGRNLACWCVLDQPCHADVLLEIANTIRCDPTTSRTGAEKTGDAGE